MHEYVVWPKCRFSIILEQATIHTHTQYVTILVASILRACHFLCLRILFVDDWYEFLIGQGKCFLLPNPRPQLIPSFHIYVGSTELQQLVWHSTVQYSTV